MTETFRIVADLDNLTIWNPKSFIVSKGSSAEIVLVVTKKSRQDIDFTSLTKTQKTMTTNGPVTSSSNISYNNTYKSFTFPVNTTYSGRTQIDLTLNNGDSAVFTLPTISGLITERG